MTPHETSHETSHVARDDTTVAAAPPVPPSGPPEERAPLGSARAAPKVAGVAATSDIGDSEDPEHELQPDHELQPLVDWAFTARRLRRQLLIVAVGIVVVWLAVGIARGSLTFGLLGEVAGFGVLIAVALEIVIVGGAALRGMLRAGERGERLAGADVSLLPPQVTCRMRRRG